MKNTLLSGDVALTRKKLLPLFLVYGTLIVLLVAAEILSPGFLAPQHMETIIRQVAFLGIVSIGQTLVILTGGIDLSVQNTLVLSNVVSAQIMAGKPENALTALVISILIGLVVGVLNGAGIYLLNIPPMIMTLAIGTAVYGVAYIYCNGAPKGYASPIFTNLANGRIRDLFSEDSPLRILNINGTILLWILLSAAVIILLKYTIFGRAVYAIGVNRQSARYSGINVPATIISVYAISGILAAITGVLFVGYTGTSYLSTGSSYNMDSIASVVIGGTSVVGGIGGYVGTIAGVMVMTMVSSIMTIVNMAESGKKIISGMILILLLVSVYRRKTSN
jgi:ribose transport system permease protein